VKNWIEYGCEALGLGLFMVSAGSFGTLLGHPDSPVVASIPSSMTRNVLMGLAMGATAIALIYSPWGRRSGAHNNPATTLTFWRLGKLANHDLAGYVSAQFAGSLVGTALVVLVLRGYFRDPPVSAVATLPGPLGAGGAFVAELIISFLLMLVVLTVNNLPRLKSYTGVVAGILVTTYIIVEATISGMSMNPARSFASAVASGRFDALWVYFIAPPLGMLAAAETYVRWRGFQSVVCAKYLHDNRSRCIFCQHQQQTNRAANASDKNREMAHA
jgi:aquaporin Z